MKQLLNKLLKPTYHFIFQENIDKENIPPPKPTAEIMSAPKHKYSKMLETKVQANLVLIQEPVEAENSEWFNVYEDGDLKVIILD